jgi:ATP-binding cassette subfamily A (ABC1) protein 3
MIVKVRNVNKVYSSGQPAVGGVSFGIGKNEVVGLLGPNGAGKSTSFSMMTMEIPKTNGEINLMNTQIENFECLQQGQYLGLAAQSNVIWDTLTVDEHLEFIGKVKGMSVDDIDFSKIFIKKTLDLTPFGDKLASQLSGGNKRKLCCAISLMSNPRIEFLDEPTTGVDPIARRSLFKMLK